MIKLLRAKEDIYWENPHDGEEPFCTKDTWYEVIKQTDHTLILTNELGMSHNWNIDEVDEYFWTIDFEKGFEYINTFKDMVKVSDGVFYNINDDFTGDAGSGIFISNIKDNTYKILRYSNQQEIKPPKQERPYENWKMSISRNKYVRCISGNRILDYQNVEGIVGFLNKDENMFYYTPTLHKYIAAKVYPFKYPDGSEGWEFVKENCDSLQKSVVPEVNDALVSSASKKSDILASFGVPEDNLGSVPYLDKNGEYTSKVKKLTEKFKSAKKESADIKTISFEEAEEYWEKVKSSGGINASLGCDGDEYTGGSVNYYKLLVERPTNLPESYEVECNDIIEALDMNYAEGNAFKAIWRKCAAKKFGIKKKGYDNGLYDSEKVVFFGERMVEQSK